MAQVNRKARYVVEYSANLGPLKRVAELQKKFNQSIQVGSHALAELGTRARASFSSIHASVSRVTRVFGLFGSAITNAMHRAHVALVTTRFEVAAMGAVISGMLSRIVTSGIKAAAAAEDIRNQFDVSFAKVHERASEIAKTMQKDLRLGEVTIKKYLSGAQDLLVGFGYTQEGALELSEQITRLALDLASWNNVPFDDAMHNMLSGLVGNHEALRSLRVVLTQAALQRKAEQLGIKESWKTMSEATKVYLRYKLAVEQSVNAIGDLQRTQNETSNRFRFFNEQLKSTTLYIFPKLTTWVGAIAEKFAIWMVNSTESFKEVGDYVARLGFHLNTVADQVIKFLSKWDGLHTATKELLIFSSSIAGIAIPILGIIVIFGRALSVVSIWYGLLLIVAFALQDIYAVMRGGNGYFREFLDLMGLTTDQARDFGYSMVDFSKSMATSIKNSIDLGAIFGVMRDAFSGIYDIILKDLVPAFKVLWKWLQGSELISTILKATYLAFKLIGDVVGLFGALISGNSERINKHLRGIRDNALGMIYTLTVGMFKFLWSTITTIVPKLLVSTISVIMSAIGMVLEAITHLIVNVFKIIFKTVRFIFVGIFQMISHVVGNIIEAIKIIASLLSWVFENKVMTTIKGVWDFTVQIIDKLRSLQDFLPDWVLEKVGLSPKTVETKAEAPVKVDDASVPKIYGPGTVIAPPVTSGNFTTQAATTATSTPQVSNNITFGDINMPITLPEGFNGDPEEFRKIAADAATSVFEEKMILAFDRNTEVE